MCARAKTAARHKRRGIVCGHVVMLAMGKGSIPQVGNGRLCTSNGGADLDSDSTYPTMGQVIFLFLFRLER